MFSLLTKEVSIYTVHVVWFLLNITVGALEIDETVDWIQPWSMSNSCLNQWEFEGAYTGAEYDSSYDVLPYDMFGYCAVMFVEESINWKCVTGNLTNQSIVLKSF